MDCVQITTSGGRPEIPKERTIVFLITDGNANSVSAANAAAEAVKEVATLFVVVVGSSINLNVVKKWATWPEEVSQEPLHQENSCVLYTMYDYTSYNYV